MLEGRNEIHLPMSHHIHQARTQPRATDAAESFWAGDGLPVLAYLSISTRRVIDAYLTGGNRVLRKKKLLEFFKCIDWMPLSELVDSGILPLVTWSVPDQRRLYAELNTYLLDKDRVRRQSAEKRQEYRLKVIEYFRQTVPRQDKMLLESLRDYELNLTGRDTNWRHHFTLDSIKKIDEFVRAEGPARQQRFAAFRQDVLTYKKNYEKLKYQAQCEHGFTFDDWCEQVMDEDFSSGRRRSDSSARGQGAITPVEQAYASLELPLGSDKETVKRQFRQLTLRFHPDVPGGSSEKMKRILSAYDAIRRYLKLLE